MDIDDNDAAADDDDDFAVSIIGAAAVEVNRVVVVVVGDAVVVPDATSRWAVAGARWWPSATAANALITTLLRCDEW